MQCGHVGSPEGNHFKTIVFITLHYSNYYILRVKTMLNDSDTDTKKSAQYRVKSRHYKWLLLITENLKENSTNFSSTHVRICVKDAIRPCNLYCSPNIGDNY